MSDLLVNVASCKTGLEAFDLLLKRIDKKVFPNKELLRKKYTDEQIQESIERLYGSREWAKDLVAGNVDISENSLQELRSYMGQLNSNIKPSVISDNEYWKAKANNNKSEKSISETSIKEPGERAHITAAKSILEKAQKLNKWDLIQKPFYKMTNSERGDFKRVFGDQRAADKFKREIQFIEQMTKEDRPITTKQKDWLSTIGQSFGVFFDKDADKASTRKLAKNKIKSSHYDEEPDMPVQREDGSWYDAETGLEITNPKYQKSYF